MSKESKIPKIHPYGPTLAYLDSQISGKPREYFDTLESWVVHALDNPQHERQWRYHNDEEETFRGESEFVSRIIKNTDEDSVLHVSVRVSTLVRMGVFRLIKFNEEDIDNNEESSIVQRIIVPKWTRDWYYARRKNMDIWTAVTGEKDKLFAINCIKSMWFTGQEWELIYSLRDMLNSISKTSWVKKSEIWASMQKKFSYHTNPKYTNRRVSLVLEMLVRAGLVKSGEQGYINVDDQYSRCPPFRKDWCPISYAEQIHFGDILEWSEKEGFIDKNMKNYLQDEIFGQWAIASAHIESQTSRTGGLTRANTRTFNESMCRIQEAIWGDRYQSHIYQASKSRKKQEHRLNGTVWPLFRVDDMTDKKLDRWGNTTWELLSLNKILEAGLAQPRRSKWTGESIFKDGENLKLSVYYQRRAAEILETDKDDPIITSLRWGGKRNAFKFIEYLQWMKDNGGSKDEIKSLLQLTIPEFNKEIMSKNLDSERPAFTYPSDFTPYEWQDEAVEAWWKGNAKLSDGTIKQIQPRSGIAEVVTGAGKTVFAIQIIKQFLDNDPQNKALIIVPTEVLLHQWYSELAKYLNIGPKYVSLIGDNNHGSMSEKEQTRVVLGIVNSLSLEYVHERLISAGIPDPGKLLVIADECHRFRGEKFRKSLEWYIREEDAKLGLSATPLGEKDDIDVGKLESEDDKLIVSGYLGERLYFYGYERARDDRLIPDFSINLVGFDLSPSERNKYKIYSDKISRSRKKIIDAVGHRLDRMRGGFEVKINTLSSEGIKIPGLKDYFEGIRERKDLLSHGLQGEGLQNRQACFEHILKKTLVNAGNSTGKKALVFQERISQIQDAMYPSGGDIRNMLETTYYRPSSVHSRRAKYRDRMTLDILRKDIINVVFSAKKLDEGLDVPAVDVGIVRIPTSSLRTIIQRLGRILRTKDGKKESDFWVLYARDTTETRFFENIDFRERISDDVIKYWHWNLEDKQPQEQEESEIKWGPRNLDIDWSNIDIGDPVKGRVEGGKFSVSSDWIPFIKKQNSSGNLSRMRILNKDHIDIASVLEEMKKAGAVYHDIDGRCVTYQRGKGGTYVGKIDTSVELQLQPYPSNFSKRSPSLIKAPSGSQMERLLNMLSSDNEGSEHE